MTAQQYFNAHKGKRVYIANGLHGNIVGYHDAIEGFERLIVECDVDFDAIGWSHVSPMDFIPDDVNRTGSGFFVYMSVKEAEVNHAR